MDRELDQQIARLLGWTWNERSAWSPCGSMWARVRGADGHGPDDPWAWLPPYSTSIEAAWTVVEHMFKRYGQHDHNGFFVGRQDGYMEPGRWYCEFSQPAWEFGEGETAAEAICQCALAALLLAPGGREGGEG